MAAGQVGHRLNSRNAEEVKYPHAPMSTPEELEFAINKAFFGDMIVAK